MVVPTGRVGYQQQLPALLYESLHDVHFLLDIGIDGQYDDQAVPLPEPLIQQRQSLTKSKKFNPAHRARPTYKLGGIPTVRHPRQEGSDLLLIEIVAMSAIHQQQPVRIGGTPSNSLKLEEGTAIFPMGSATVGGGS